MGFKKFLTDDLLRGVKVAAQFSPLLTLVPGVGTAAVIAKIAAGGLRVAARIDPEDAEPFLELTRYIADQLNDGVPEDDRLRADASALYINRVRDNTGKEPAARNVGLAYYSALAHVRGELGLDAIEEEGG